MKTVKSNYMPCQCSGQQITTPLMTVKTKNGKISISNEAECHHLCKSL